MIMYRNIINRFMSRISYNVSLCDNNIFQGKLLRKGMMQWANL